MFEEHRSPTEQLKELFLETNHPEVLNRLIQKAGFLVLLDLDIKGLDLLSQMIFVQNRYDLIFSISKPRDLKRFFNYVIDKFTINKEDEIDENMDVDMSSQFVDGVIQAIEVCDWEGGRYVTKALVNERYSFIIRLLASEKNNKYRKYYNYYNDLLEAVVKNRTISNEVILDFILPEIPDISKYFLKNICTRFSGENDIFNIVDNIGKVKDRLFKINETGGTIECDRLLKESIDMMLNDDITQELLFGLFVSVEKISNQIIYYRLEEFKLFFERFVLMFKEVKDTVNFYIESSAENEGIFPLGEINDEISAETVEGLAYCIFHGSTISDYNIVKDDRFLMDSLAQVSRSLGLYIYMGILPETWVYNDEYFHVLQSQEDASNRTFVSDSETGEINLDEFLEGLN